MKPEKKRTDHLVGKTPANVTNWQNEGYNKCKEEYDEWIIEELDRIMKAPPLEGCPAYTSLMLDLRALRRFIKGEK